MISTSYVLRIYAAGMAQARITLLVPLRVCHRSFTTDKINGMKKQPGDTANGDVSTNIEDIEKQRGIDGTSHSVPDLSGSFIPEHKATARTPSADGASDATADKCTADCHASSGADAKLRGSPPEKEPLRWAMEAPGTSALEEPIVDENGQFIVSRVQWPTGELAYTTPPPPDVRVAPRFGYNVVQVKKHVSWWKHYQEHPRFSVAYLNIQILFLLVAAWLMAFLAEEYRRVTDELRTPGAMVGEHRGRGPVGRGSQKISFTKDEMDSLIGRAQDNWMDAKAEANYVGSKDYAMRKIPRPKEFSVEDFRKR
uniref:Uncharacterized protein n=1 Tax=Trypanosoma congolense (strain IL3000) TaxID=1068625 RepID=G0UMY2_TRYCI|nr:conserved hypothetical protein [Trypanosoma congolense IL3000]